MKVKFFLSVFILLLFSFSVYAQTSPSGGITGIISSIDTLRNRLPIEKAYLQFDKPYYTTGDTLWFKAYLFDAAYLSASERSGVLYLELANDTGKVLQRNMVLIDYGLGRGNIFLNKENIPEGSYTLRAYTNLMRNFGEDYVFKKSFYISSTADQSWLVKSDVRLSKAAGKDSIRMALQFSKLNKDALSFRELQLRVMEGKKVLFRDKVQTDVDGELDVNFSLPEKSDARNISIVAEDLTSTNNRKITIPVPVNRPENIDLQFMPEGGNLVAGIATKVGFKAIGEDGKGADVKGKVVSSSVGVPLGQSRSKEVAVFNSAYKGMGFFELNPQAGESYTAQIELPDGTIKNYLLPQIKASGTALRISNSQESDSLEITISVTASATATYYLIAQSRGIVCYAATIRFNNSISTIRKIAKKLFPSGITRFSLLSTDQQPLNERIVFIDHEDNLNISINTNKEAYSTRDSVALNILVTDKDNKPVQGSFSLAVTDDGQVKADSLGSTILTNLLLTSDLKGTIEEPVYYLGNEENRWTDLDNLLLTQGWVGYDWQQVLNPPANTEYKAEPEFAVKGRVSNVLNKDIEGSKVRLISQKPLLLADTITDKNGLFAFRGFPQLDTVAFLLRATNKKGYSANIGVEVEEFKAPVFQNEQQRFMPWYMNSDTSLLKYINNTVAQRTEAMKLPGNSRLLDEVSIMGKKIIKDSHNLNGPGNADQVLDENDIRKGNKMPLVDFLRQKLRGFSFGSTKCTPPSYKIFESSVHFIIDGINLDFFYSAPEVIPPVFRGGPATPVSSFIYMDFIKSYLDYFTAEDVKGIEVMYRQQYNSNYNTEFNMDKIMDLGIKCNYAYIEITTYDGSGPFLKHTPGVYLYKTMPFAGSKTFYSPRYTVKNIIQLPDFRSTIHWEPDVITNAEGKAVVSFYSADKTGTYTIIAEGSDMDGNIGSERSKIKIIPK